MNTFYNMWFDVLKASFCDNQITLQVFHITSYLPFQIIIKINQKIININQIFTIQCGSHKHYRN